MDCGPQGGQKGILAGFSALGGLGFADTLLQALFTALAFAAEFFFAFDFLVSHVFLLFQARQMYFGKRIF